MVKIPGSFASRLDAEGPRFLLVLKRDKAAFERFKDVLPSGEEDTLYNHLYLSTDPKLGRWLQEGGNYGDAAGDGLIIIDTDNEALVKLAEEKFPATLTVKSPGSGGYHYYFKCRVTQTHKKSIALLNPEDTEKNWGTIRVYHGYVVGPGCIHPNGGTYEVVKDLDIAELPEDTLFTVYDPYIRARKNIRLGLVEDFLDDAPPTEKLDITQLVPMSTLTCSADGTKYQGPHPLHSSKTGTNFVVTPSENVYYCFHCETGGGPWEYLAMQEGLIECADVEPGCLRGMYRRLKEIARGKGYIKPLLGIVNPEITLPDRGAYISDLTTAEMLVEDVVKVLATTIKDDTVNKTITFYGTVLNYTEADQQNFSSGGPSAVGKSYNTEQVLALFPQEDVVMKGYTSPTAFFHQNSNLSDAQGKPLPSRDQYVNDGIKIWMEKNPKPAKHEGREEWKDKRINAVRQLKAAYEAIEKMYVADFEAKILSFRDQPHDKLLQNLRPVLSHDSKIIECEITDRTREGGNKTKRVLIKGYPTVHFNSVRFSLDDQERTRLWLLSPEITQKKFKATIKLQSEALANRTAYTDKLAQDEARNRLKARLRLIKESPVRNVIIHPEDAERIYLQFIADHPQLQPRHQRDFPRIIAMIKAHALFNQWTREATPDGKAVYATQKDVEEGFKLCEELVKSNELGLPPHVFRFYEELLHAELAKGEGLHRRDVSRLYYEFYRTRIGEKPLGHMISLLLETGLAVEEVDPDDKRSKKIYAPSPGGEKSGNTSAEVAPQPNDKALIADVEDFYRRLNTKTTDLENLHSYLTRKKHKVTTDELQAILRGHGYKMDGFTVTKPEVPA